MLQKKFGTEIQATVFTDHLAVALLIKMNIPIAHPGVNYWKLNTILLCDIAIIQRFKGQWTIWKTIQGRCKDSYIWWDIHGRYRMRPFFVSEAKRKVMTPNCRNIYAFRAFMKCS